MRQDYNTNLKLILYYIIEKGVQKCKQNVMYI